MIYFEEQTNKLSFSNVYVVHDVIKKKPHLDSLRKGAMETGTRGPSGVVSSVAGAEVPG